MYCGSVKDKIFVNNVPLFIIPGSTNHRGPAEKEHNASHLWRDQLLHREPSVESAHRSSKEHSFKAFKLRNQANMNVGK